MQTTTSSEAAAFFLARAIVIAAMFYITPRLLAPLYLQILREGGSALFTVISFGVSVVGWLVTLILFLALRASFGGTPAIVAPSGQQSQLTSSGGEIGAFAITATVVTLLLWGFYNFVMPSITAAIREAGRTDLQFPLSITISAVAAVLFFLLFVAHRDAMSPPAASHGSP
jgi:hypothetical protein